MRIISVKVCSKRPYSARRMLTSKIAYFAERSTGRIYPSLRMGLVRTILLIYLENLFDSCDKTNEVRQELSKQSQSRII